MSNHPDDLGELAQSLEEYYGVTDQDSALKAIDAFSGNNSVSYGVLFHLLYRAYESIGEKLTSMNYAEFEREFVDDEVLRELLAHYKIEPEDENLREYKDYFRKFGEWFFNGEDENGELNLVVKFTGLFKQLGKFYPLCKNAPITAAFDYARALQIASESYALGYIGEAEYQDFTKTIGEATQGLFNGWDEFIAGFILGRAFAFIENASEARNYFINDNLAHMNDFYVLINSPYKMFKESGIWGENLDAKLASINEILKSYIDLDEDKKQNDETALIIADYQTDADANGFSFDKFNQTLDIYIAKFHNVLKEYKCEFLMNQEICDFMTPKEHLKLENSLFTLTRKFINKHKISLAPDELVMMCGRDFMVTTKAFYTLSGMIFFKKLKITPWKDAQLQVKVHYTGDLRCYANKDDFFEICLREYEKLTGKKASLEDSENAMIFKDEITALSLGLKSLKECLVKG